MFIGWRKIMRSNKTIVVNRFASAKRYLCGVSSTGGVDAGNKAGGQRLVLEV